MPAASARRRRRIDVAQRVGRIGARDALVHRCHGVLQRRCGGGSTIAGQKSCSISDRYGLQHLLQHCHRTFDAHQRILHLDLLALQILGLPVIKDLIVDMKPFFDHYKSVLPFLINDDPALCLGEIRALLKAERLARRRQIGLAGFVREMLAKT